MQFFGHRSASSAHSVLGFCKIRFLHLEARGLDPTQGALRPGRLLQDRSDDIPRDIPMLCFTPAFLVNRYTSRGPLLLQRGSDSVQESQSKLEKS